MDFEIGPWITVPGFTFEGERFLPKFTPTYNVYFGLAPVAPPNMELNAVKAALAGLRRDISSCPRCSHASDH